MKLYHSVKNEILYKHNDYQVYPGAYVPLLNEDQLEKEIKRSFDCESSPPPVIINELTDSYIVELTIPGINREDFLVHADDNVLSICVLHRESCLDSAEKNKLHGFNYGLFDRHIHLPAHADVAFISAEYADGMLRFHIPKTDQPVRNLHNRIVVY